MIFDALIAPFTEFEFRRRALAAVIALHRERKARATIVPMWKVADVRRAVEAVRAAGGTATDPERQPYGTTSECADDQGMRFYLGDA